MLIMTNRLLTVEQVAELLGTTARFPRRLIAERRIEYVKVGRHVRIAEHVVEAFVAAHTITPARRLRGVA